MPVIFEVKCYQYLICLKNHIQKYNEFQTMIPKIMGFEGYCFRLVAMTIRWSTLVNPIQKYSVSFCGGYFLSKTFSSSNCKWLVIIAVGNTQFSIFKAKYETQYLFQMGQIIQKWTN